MACPNNRHAINSFKHESFSDNENDQSYFFFRAKKIDNDRHVRCWECSMGATTRLVIDWPFFS